jgi:glycosyltransferase involved in cell wall biosynthesis
MKVTVVIPVFNGEKHLEVAIRSVLTQTHQDFELIVINDGSKDRSLEISEQLALADSRIRVLTQENQGIAATLNRGLHEAETDWVMIMHADDAMLPNRLEKQILFIQNNPDLRACSCLAIYISETGKEFGKTTSDLLTREKFQWYVSNNEAIGILHPGTAVHRQTVLEMGGYRQAYWPAEDIDLWNRLAEKGYLILVQNEPLMKYRIHFGSISTARFMSTRQKYEWVRSCMYARRCGKEEPTWESFQHEWNHQPLWVKLNRNRKGNAKAYYHAAGHDYLRKEYFLCFIKLAAAFLLQPLYVLPRLRKQVLHEA